MGLKYKRILLKLSGEALSGEQKFGLDYDVVQRICESIKKCTELGAEVAIVVGGGNFWRGRSSGKMDRTRADHMGMLGTVINALALADALEQLEVPDYKADVCVAFAQGNMGKAIMLANSEYFNEIKEEVVHLLRNIDEMTVPDLMEAVKRCMIYKMEISDYLDMIAIWYRDVLIYKATRSVDRVVFSDQMKYIRERAKKSSYEGIENILDSLEKAKARMKANVNFELTMELLLLTIKEN